MLAERFLLTSRLHSSPTRRATLALALFVAVATSPSPHDFSFKAAWPAVVAVAQDDPLRALTDEYAQLESQGLKENFHRQLSYTMLQEYLPSGTRMTSGYRSPEKQLGLILRMARAQGIPAPAQGSVEDESSWRPALMGLRSKGYIVAAPTTTPHATDEAVFDLSGADLNAIQQGLRRAESAGMVKFRRIIFEAQNNAIHVEVESISPKALNALGRRRPASGGGTSSGTGGGTTGGGGGTAPASEADQQRSMVQQLQNLHDSEPDPAKKIDYDRSQKNLLNPADDAARIAVLDEEIARHQEEAQQLTGDTRRKQAVEGVSEALRDERYEDAEQAAELLVESYPDIPEAKDMLAQIRTRRLIDAATDAIYASDEPACDECEKASELMTEALELSPDYEGAQFIKEDIDACLARCKTGRLPFIILSLLLLAGAGAGLYYLARSGNLLPRLAGALKGSGKSPVSGGGGAARGWVLEGIDGACRGQVFPLEKAELVIGSKGPPEGVADIVVLDAQRKISRRHCTVMQNGKQFYLMDESTNGTSLNGQPAARGTYVEFRAGDHISLADVAVLRLRPKG
ncbi:MAG TPA: FHA domain-containing protein [Pyrinomonadaceae bacterium]